MLPKGTPAAIVKRLSAALANAETDETFIRITGTANIPIMYLDSEAAKDEMMRTYKEYGEIYRKAGVEPR